MTTRKLLAVLAALVLALAACGGGDETDGGDDGGDAGGGTELVGDAANGATIYSTSCASCHAPDATGIDGLGKPLVGSELVMTSSETELAEFIKVGRPSSDPENTTGIDMPAKGGNPSLTDQDLHDVAAYLQGLN